MTGRDRIRAALGGKEPDRVPRALAFYRVEAERIAPKGAWRDDLVDVRFARFETPEADAGFFDRAAPAPFPDTRLGTPERTETYRRWGYRIGAPRGRNPLASARTLDDLERFPFPGEEAPVPAGRLRKQVEHIHRRGLAAGGNPPHLGGELFETAWRLRGLENFLIDLARRPDWADLLLERLAARVRRFAAALAAAGVDLISLDDDVGMPGSMMISPETWRRFFKGRLASILEAARRESPDVFFLYHSDGWFEPILEDLVEIGFHAVNPVQPEHMDAVGIRRRFGPRLALWGTVGRQTTFSHGTPEEIEAEVRLRVETLGRAGLVLAPAYDIDEEDVPWSNVEAFLAAAARYGAP
ncbi:MAG: uroporphyrinogen decarboxylase family protein [Candidatus Eisenbacteria bacterium]